MKKVLLSLVALAAMVACNNEETVVVDSHSLITFDNSFVEVKTRLEDPSITTTSIDAFDVWGFIDTASGTVFSQEPVAKTADNKWEYANKQYWLPNLNYFFYAVAPAHALAHPTVERENTAIEVNTAAMDPKGLGTISFTNVDGTLDLLYAEQTVETLGDVITNDPGKVNLQFMHLLSKVQFTFKNAFTNNNATLKVTGLKITNAPKKGSVAVNKARTEYAWVIVQGETTTLEFGDVNGGEAFMVSDSKGSDRARLTIPADATRSYDIEFDLTLYYGDQVAGTSHKIVNLENQTLAIGKNYNIVAEVGPDNFADDALKSIEFDVITVETWEDGVINGNVDFDNQGGNNGGNQGGNQEPTQPVALAAPVVTATVDGNVVTLTWEAIEGAAEYTVQVDDDVVETVNTPTYTFNGDYEVEYTFTVKAIAADKAKNTDSEAVVVKETTEAKPADPVNPEYTTVAEFKQAAEDETTYYTLKGTITAVANDKYGNFDLTDDTGTVHIYGLCSPDGTTNQYWAASGAKLGDDITVKTIRASFNNTPQGKNAWFVKLDSGTRAFYTVNPAGLEFSSTGGEKDIEVNAYNTNAAVTATSDNGVFGVAVNGYVVTVTAAANELEQEVSGNITIQVGDLEATVVTVTLAAKPASGVVEGGRADFNTISSTNTSYVSGKTTAGWNYVNCAIFKGGTTDSSPAFKMIGAETNRALCMNGHTDKVGKIESPEFTTGCGTLKFNYGLPFSDTKMKFRVDIIQDGATVHTFTVDVPSATKLEKCSHEEAVNVSGTFKMVFTNLSPSNQASNKDRTAIWDVEWTGCN